MLYPYRDVDSGEQVVVEAKMTDPPPERFTDDQGRRLERVFEPPMFITKGDHAVRHKGHTIPVSMSMPPTQEKGEPCTLHGHPVKRLRNGTYATLDGKRIVDSKRSADLHAGECGMKRVT